MSSAKAVPLCDIQASYSRLRSPIDEAIRRVLASGQVILGPEVAALEREVAAECEVSHAIGCSSGSDALLLAVVGLGIGPGDEVILPPFTFFATAGAVCRAGASPIFADVDPNTFNIDPRQVEERITPRTKAIMPVHLYGQCADMDVLATIAERHKVPLIEDAAQAYGAEHRGRKAGSMGAAGCFSFYPTKTLGAFGEAGLVTTNNAALAARMMSLRVHGMRERYHHAMMGWNARIDALQAAILRVKLPHVPEFVRARQMAAKRYDDLIFARKLDEMLEVPQQSHETPHTFNQYVVKVAGGRRDELMRHLKANGVGCEVYYPVPVHLQDCLAHLGHRSGDFPVSEELARSVIALPIFPEITAEQQERVITTCASLLRSSRRTVSRLAA
jgi:dTDP-4-amino-4,6-dideoxygalactose transaminase